MLAHSSGEDRRLHPRTFSHAEAVVKTRRSVEQYTVENLSVGGALLSGGPLLKPGSVVTVLLKMPLYPEIRIPARVVRHAGTDGHLAVAFLHENDTTEDHIQSALLSELERSHTQGVVVSLPS